MSAKLRYIPSHGLRRFSDGPGGKHVTVDARTLREGLAELRIGEQARSTLSVMDDGNVDPDAEADGQEGDVFHDTVIDATAHVAQHARVTGLQSEKPGGLHARIDARQHDQHAVGHVFSVRHGQRSEVNGRGEVAITSKQLVEVSHSFIPFGAIQRHGR